jgi:GntR family transcriptional repressor for pyruvate dehydrogenase complex
MTQESSIAAQLRDDILRGQYRCGERLPSERDLAERFSVHRSTVRAAFKRLEQLGIAEVRPGGARVCPIEEASLEVLQHMIELQDPPDANLVDQTLEAMSGFLAHAARVGSERATGANRARLLSILDEMIRSEPTEERRAEFISTLGAAFDEASGNPVLALLRHGLRTHSSNYLRPENRNRPVSAESIAPHLLRLRGAIATGDGAAASEAVYGFTAVIRRTLRASLEEEHARVEREAGQSVDAAVGAGGER